MVGQFSKAKLAVEIQRGSIGEFCVDNRFFTLSRP
jgi:hypothetical protein